MRNDSNNQEVNKPEAGDRIAIALLSAGFGFLTGMIIWFAMPRAFDIAFSVFFRTSVILAVVFSFVGFFSPAFTSKALGNIWDVVRVINRKIFFWVRLIK